MSPLLVAIAAFIGVTALVGGVAMLIRGNADPEIEDRLDMLTGLNSPSSIDPSKQSSVLSSPLDASSGAIEEMLKRFGNIQVLFDQADVTLTVPKFLSICLGTGLVGGLVFAFAGVPPALVPVVAICAGGLPLTWLLFRRKRRLRKFGAQLPDALELISRALRAGHSLGAGFQLVASEMAEPINREFGRVFEEQNLGIPFDDALESMTKRVPNLDLKFFATAVLLQRQTGGDLAEILDKIGHLVRERFKIWGQVQALTGEGRLSGIVLLALPPALFLAVYRLNPEYVMVLFTDEMGQQMLITGAIMQLLGAIVIRKIVNIKV
jgi:tight adherence protein B